MTALRLPPGHVIAGKYSLQAPLGYGGATASYAATSSAGRSVVVKLYSPQLADRSDVLGVLQRAAAATNALPADATAPILDVGFDPQTRSPYTVTEAIAMPSLLVAVQAGPLPPADVAAVVQGIARAVDAAHAQKLAHGGLKPQNVFVGAGPQRSVKVIDFGTGVARAALPTAEGGALAAPWLAPEQLSGAPDTPAVDVFSAALVAFFAATGRPFWRSCQTAMPDLAGWQQELAAPLPAASTRARELGAALPAAWDPVFARALSANPAERFGSVSELAHALASAAGAPVAVLPQGGAPAVAQAAPGDEPVETPRSRAGLVVALAIVGVVVVIGVVGLVISLRKPHAAPVVAAASASSAPAIASSSPPPAAASSVASAGEAPVAVPSAEATPAASASDTPVAEMAQLIVLCTPECDTVTIDADVLDSGLSDPQALPPGVHTIGVTKATFVSQTRKVTLKAGQKEKASFFLARPGPAPAKPCGKFLERCP